MEYVDAADLTLPMQREEVLEELMETYGDAIVRLSYTYTKDTVTAEDLAQEIFIKCYEKLPTFNQQASIKTWLFKVAINHCKDHVRSWHFRKVTLFDKLRPGHTAPLENEVVRREESDRLATAVLQLPLPMREAIYLYYYEGLSVSEIAALTNGNVNTIKSRLKKAREKLRVTAGGLRDEE
ncbi:sigma-70 family RNA polymerase sigma factor [Alkalicoccus luteus]|uniref:Sigma-70 family RNA polymerase sigma factor n=1 Tax=Alkalicoccus luteus TaxID=1237094 RepID=A0A969PR89_9BACI|nr:sigma-70 family RNA polymerase sigma factor [Alkalicoccus luteus]NJP37544.1 sigma-70 family RNA polymerase sigma factor [Alkalicoccus luteus]